MSEDEFDGMFHPTSANPKLPVRVVNAEPEPPLVPVDAFDSDPDETYRLTPEEQGKRDEWGNVELEGEL